MSAGRLAPATPSSATLGFLLGACSSSYTDSFDFGAPTCFFCPSVLDSAHLASGVAICVKGHATNFPPLEVKRGVSVKQACSPRDPSLVRPQAAARAPWAWPGGGAEAEQRETRRPATRLRWARRETRARRAALVVVVVVVGRAGVRCVRRRRGGATRSGETATSSATIGPRPRTTTRWWSAAAAVASSGMMAAAGGSRGRDARCVVVVPLRAPPVVCASAADVRTVVPPPPADCKTRDALRALRKKVRWKDGAVGDAGSSLGDAESSLGDAKSSLGDT